ncbi:hypothetical protein SA58113_1253 [Staphylococcus argenteus]|nr:hypothetical protein SA58113_1253 [Staphylococcus argenteus]
MNRQIAIVIVAIDIKSKWLNQIGLLSSIAEVHSHKH